MIEFIQSNWVGILEAAGLIVAGASVLVKLTPTPKDDAILAKIIAVLNLVALNPKK